MEEKIEEVLEGGETTSAFRLSELIFRAIYKFSVISIKSSHDIFHQTKMTSPKIHMESQQIAPRHDNQSSSQRILLQVSPYIISNHTTGARQKSEKHEDLSSDLNSR